MMRLPERFAKRVAFSDGCWIWEGGVTSRGYGAAYHDGRQQLAHRVAYEVLVGPIPDGLVIDHLCRVKLCVNPAHLEAVTQKENCARADTSNVDYGAFNRAKTHCLNGHAFTPANTLLLKDGSRRCRTCHRGRQAASRARRRRVA